MKQTHSTSAAIISYGQGIPASYPACKTTADDLTAGGIKVSYLDLDASLAGDFTAAAQQILNHGSDFVLTCIQGSDNITLARALQQYGVHVTQLWLSGYDQSLLDQYQRPDARRLRGRKRLRAVHRAGAIPGRLPRHGALPLGHEDSTSPVT